MSNTFNLFRASVLTVVFALLAGFGGVAAAQSKPGNQSSQFMVSAEVRAEFDVVETRAVPGGYELRVMTNLREQRINGVTYSLRPGENILFVPASTTRRDDMPVTEVLY